VEDSVITKVILHQRVWEERKKPQRTSVDYRAYIYFKRCMDVIISAFLLLLLAPLLLFIAILIKLDSPGPVTSCIGGFLRKSSLGELPQLWNIPFGISF